MPMEDLTERNAADVAHGHAYAATEWETDRFLPACLNLLAFSSFHAVFYYFKTHVIKTAPGKATFGEGLL